MVRARRGCVKKLVVRLGPFVEREVEVSSFNLSEERTLGLFQRLSAQSDSAVCRLSCHFPLH